MANTNGIIDLYINYVRSCGIALFSQISVIASSKHILTVLFDDSVQVHIHEVLAGHGAPVANDLLFHVVPGQGAAQKRVIQQVKLTRRQVVGRPPVGVYAL